MTPVYTHMDIFCDSFYPVKKFYVHTPVYLYIINADLKSVQKSFPSSRFIHINLKIGVVKLMKVTYPKPKFGKLKTIIIIYSYVHIYFYLITFY